MWGNPLVRGAGDCELPILFGVLFFHDIWRDQVVTAHFRPGERPATKAPEHPSPGRHDLHGRPAPGNRELEAR
jgi:hypothetical protein